MDSFNLRELMTGFTELEAEIQSILSFFTYNHLPADLQKVSQPFCELAERVAMNSQSPQTLVALQRLLESKDAAVTAAAAQTSLARLEAEIQGLLTLFTYSHLPVDLQEASKPFRALAEFVASTTCNRQTVVALEKLLESKHALVRAASASKKIAN